jgi:hypothetical protein
VNLLSKRVANRMDGLARELPTASEDTVKRDEQRNGQKSAARKAMPPITAPVSVVAVRAEVRAMEPVRVPERAEDKTEDQRDCDEDEYGWDNDKGEHCVFSVELRCERPGSPDMRSPVSRKEGQAEWASPFSRGFIAFTLVMRS